MHQTLSDWLKRIESFHHTSIDLGLERISLIGKEMGLLEFPCPVILVAGTNGKGSCVRFLESLYSKAGYRVGAYYSPHLYRFNERIRVNEQEISDEDLIQAFIEVDKRRRSRPLSAFEFITLASLYYFQQVTPDLIILEVGLGGRLDAVNIVEPTISIVTSVGLDHMDFLGPDREAIAYEKAGIFRPNKPAICGDWDPPESLLMHAGKLKSDLYRINKEFRYQVEGNDWSWTGPKSQYKYLPTPQLKSQNIATSLMAVELLQKRLPIDEVNIKKAAALTRLSGRFETFNKPVHGVFDVAHNPDSAKWLAEQIARQCYSGKKVAVVGMMKDKDIQRTLDYMLPHVDLWYAAAFEDPRCADPEEILAHLRASGVTNCYKFYTVSEAIRQAVHACTGSEDRLIVFGSFRTVSDAGLELRSIEV